MRRIPLFASPVAGYAFAILGAFTILVSRLSLRSTGVIDGGEAPFVTLFTVVLATALLGGFGPAVLSVVLSGVVTGLFYWDQLHPSDAFRVALVLLDLGVALLLVRRLTHALNESRQALEAERSAVVAASRADARNAELLDATGAVAWEANDPGYPYAIDFVSRGITDLLGYSMQEVLADRFWASIIHEDDWERVTAEEQRLMHEQDQYVMEYRARRKDGGIAWVRDTVTVERYADGGVMRLRGLMVDITELKFALMEAQRRQAWLETVLAGVPSLIWEDEHLPDGSVRVKMLSPNTETITGYPRERFDDPAFWPSIVSGSAGAALADRLSPPAPGEVRTREERLLAADGTQRWMESRARGLYDADGKLIGVMGADIDVTERKAAEAERARLASEVEHERDQLRRLLDDVQGIAWESGPDYIPYYYSAGTKRILGYSPEEMSGSLWYSLVSEEDLQAVRALEWALADQGGELTQEYRIRAKDGRTVWLREHVRSIHGDGGAITSLRGLAVDVTELKEAAAAERRAREEADALVDAIPGIVIVEGQAPFSGPPGPTIRGRYVEHLLGYTAAELNGSRSLWATTMHPDDAERRTKQVRHAYENGTPIEAARFRAKDGTIRWLTTRMQVLPERDGSRGFVEVLVDVTREREAERALERLQASTEQERAFLDGLLGDINGAVVEVALGPEPRITYVSPAVERLLGYTPDECRAMGTLLAHIHPEDASFEKGRQALDAGRDEFALEYRIRHRDGHYFWLREFARVQRDDAGLPRSVRNLLVDITPEKEIEIERAALATTVGRQRDYLETLLADINGAVWEHAPDLDHLSYISPSVERLLGFTPDECYAIAAWTKTVHPQDGAAAQALVKRIAGGLRDYTFEYRQQRKDGSYTWVRDTARVYRDAAGTVSSIRGLTVDISDLKAAQEERERVAHRLESVIAQVPGVVWETRGMPGEGGELTFVSGGAVRMLGRLPDAIRADWNGFVEAIHPDDRQETLAAMRSVLTRREPASVDGRRFRADGSEVWVEARMAPAIAADGSVVGVVGVTLDITERKRSEAALRTANRALAGERSRLSAIIENTPAIVCESHGRPGDDEEIVFVSDYAEQLLGYAPDRLREPGFIRRLHHAADTERVAALYERVYETGTPESLEYRCMASDGREVWVQNWCRRLSDGEGHPIGLIGVATDISARKQADSAIAAANEAMNRERGRLAAILASVPAMVRESRGEPGAGEETIFVSDYARTLLGRDPGDWLRNANYWLDIVHPDDRGVALEAARAAFVSGETIATVYRCLNGDGGEAWIEKRHAPIRDASGSVQGLLSVSIDVSERKRAEDRIRAERERYRALIESLPGSVWEARGEPGSFEVTFLSGAEGLLGYSLQEWQGDQDLWSEVVHPEDLSRNRDITREALQNWSVVIDEVRVRRKDGQMAWVESRVNPIFDEDGQPQALVGFASDITERKMAEFERERLLRDLEEEQRKVSALLASVPVLIQADEIVEGGGYRITTLSAGSFAETLGYSYERLCDVATWEEIIHPEDYPRVQAALRAVEQDGWPALERVRWRTASGSERWVEVRLTPVFGEKGSVTGHRNVAVDITERVASDRERDELIASLREEREKVEALLASLPVVISETSLLPEPHITQIAGDVERLLGYGPDVDYLDTAFWHDRVLPPGERQLVEEETHSVISAGGSRTIRGRWRKADGALLWVDRTIWPVVGETGDVRAVRAIATDVTVQVEAQERLERLLADLDAERQRFADLVENVPGLVFEAIELGDDRRGTRFISGFAERLLGYSETQLHDVEFWRQHVNHPDDSERVVREIGEAAREGRPGMSRFRWIGSHGDVFWVDSRYRPVFEDGRVIGFRGVAVDVTDQVRGEEERERLLEELTRTHDQVETLLGSLPALVFETRGNPRDDEHFIFMAGGVERITGYTLAQHSDLRFWKEHIIHPDDRARDLEQSADVLESGLPGVIRERWLTSRGRTIWVETRMRPVFDAGGSAIGLRGVSVEITDQVHAEEALRESNEQKDEFLGLVSHELRTPITAIYGGARFLRTRNASEEDRQVLLEDIERESERMHRLVENLLTLARAELGRGPEMEPVLTNRVIEQTVRAYVHRRPGREVRLELEEGLPPVVGTQSYLEQIVRNLVSNADKYSPPTEPILVRTLAPDSRHVAIQVLDEGPGLGDTEPERLFERFYRSRETQNVASGLGLGLTVCKRLVEAMGGTITAHKRPERGLELRVTLPISEEEA